MLVVMLLGVVGGSSLLAFNDAVASSEDSFLLPLFYNGVGAFFAYLLVVLNVLYELVVRGLATSGDSHFGQFAALCLLAAGIELLAVLLRYEMSPPYPWHDGCGYVKRDGWTGNTEVKQLTCPEQGKPKGHFVVAH